MRAIRAQLMDRRRRDAAAALVRDDRFAIGSSADRLHRIEVADPHRREKGRRLS
jgi:hypothetical protein